jgi:hypothetical protein
MAGRDAPIKVGNTLPLRNIPIGSTVHCIEMKPGKGAQIARSAGASAQLIAREQGYATLRLRSGEMRKVPADCRATIGEVGNGEHSLEQEGQGRRQALAGYPPDGPRRGDEPGRPSARRWRRPYLGRPHPVSPWGLPTKGYKTRNNKRTEQFIVRRRTQVIRTRIMARSLKKGPFVDLHLMKKVEAAPPATARSRSRPGRVARWSCRTWWATRSPSTTASSMCRCWSTRTWSGTSSASSP